MDSMTSSLPPSLPSFLLFMPRHPSERARSPYENPSEGRHFRRVASPPDVAVPILPSPDRPSSSFLPALLARRTASVSRSGSHGKLFPSHVETRLRRTTTGMGWRWRRWRQRRWRRWRALRTLPDLIVFCLPPSAEDGVESAQKTFSLFKKKKVAAYLAGYGRHAVRD